MNAFHQAKQIEALAMALVVPWLSANSLVDRFVFTDKGTLSQELQKTAGDILANGGGRIYGMDVKAEQENRHGNFYLETWSNKKWRKRGWLDHLKCDFIFYVFVDTKELFIIPLARLQKWAFDDERILDFPEKPQKKYSQLNDTWGRCVPISIIKSEVGFRRVSLGETSGSALEAAVVLRFAESLFEPQPSLGFS